MSEFRILCQEELHYKAGLQKEKLCNLVLQILRYMHLACISEMSKLVNYVN